MLAAMPIGGLQGPLCEGRAWFFEGGRYGFMSADADVVVPPVLEEAANYHEGRALAKRGGRYGFIDLDGREVVPSRYRRATTFGGGRALVWDEDGRVLILDRDGAVVAPCPTPIDDASGVWSDGLQRVRRARRYGFVDTNGAEVVACVYDDAHVAFAHGCAGVCRDGRWGFVDRGGREVVACDYRWVEPFAEEDGTAGVMRGDAYGRVEPDGRERVPCLYASPVGRLREGRARVDLGPITDPGRDGDGVILRARVGFVDDAGAVVIPCRYESATEFADGVAWVTTPTRRARFAIDREGREVPGAATPG